MKITDDLPLTQLLKGLGSMFEKRMELSDCASKPVTHDTILEVSDYALAQTWPDGDHAAPSKRLSTRRSDVD